MSNAHNISFTTPVGWFLYFAGNIIKINKAFRHHQMVQFSESYPFFVYVVAQLKIEEQIRRDNYKSGG